MSLSVKLFGTLDGVSGLDGTEDMYSYDRQYGGQALVDILKVRKDMWIAVFRGIPPEKIATLALPIPIYSSVTTDAVYATKEVDGVLMFIDENGEVLEDQDDVSKRVMLYPQITTKSIDPENPVTTQELYTLYELQLTVVNSNHSGINGVVIATIMGKKPTADGKGKSRILPPTLAVAIQQAVRDLRFSAVASTTPQEDTRYPTPQ